MFRRASNKYKHFIKYISSVAAFHDKMFFPFSVIHAKENFLQLIMQTLRYSNRIFELHVWRSFIKLVADATHT